MGGRSESRSSRSHSGRSTARSRVCWRIPSIGAQRLEFTGGYRNISFAAQTEVDLFDPITGNFIGRSKQDIDTPGSLKWARSALRWYMTPRFSEAPARLPVSAIDLRSEECRHLSFGTLLLDYRKYIRLGPFTLAGRGFHYGRYGGNAEDNRLQDLFLGYDSLIRGYDPNSFSLAECGPQVQTTGNCPAFDRLMGSRIAVGNAELRLPLFGPLGVIYKNFLPNGGSPLLRCRSRMGPLRPALVFRGAADTARQAVSSYGGSLRVNILGFAVGQVSRVSQRSA